MVELRNRRLLIDGKPSLVFAAEIHYFRLRRGDWADRIGKAKSAGCNAIASYVPWLIHEPRRGEVDLTGERRPENNVLAFIDLCHEAGLWFIPRPGPFVMAEMKNEGIPYWVYRDVPSAIPVTWAGETPRSKTLDYLNPEFLDAAEAWYGAVMPPLAERLQPNGGPVIGVQLDNEIGMLSWVNNQPDLNEGNLRHFADWLGRRYGEAELARRYPFGLTDPSVLTKRFRDPQPTYAAPFHWDFGHFCRDRNAEYVAALRGFAEAHGVRGVPFLINIHGTGNGRGFTFPVGIHHLFRAYSQADGYWAGSDFYLGEFDRAKAGDLYWMNAFMAAVNRPDQPLSSLEFEVGTGDYGETGATRQSAASANLKIRMCLTQGNRLLNYYLFAGGENPYLEDPVGDGNDRVAFTGQRHGFAAPISPEGELDPTYCGLRITTSSMSAVAEKLADMDEELDGVSLAFVPDYYNTDFARPGPMNEIVAALEAPRGYLDILSRAMLFAGFRFGASDIQNRPIDTPCLAFASGRLLDASTQQKLVAYVSAGGQLLLHGELPEQDLETRPCTILADALGLRSRGQRVASGDDFPSLRGLGWAADQPEVRVGTVQTFAHHEGAFLQVVGTDEVAGLELALGAGRAIVVTANVPCHVPFFSAMFEHLGAKPGLTHNYAFHGLLMTTVANSTGERFLSILNLDAETKQFYVMLKGSSLFEHELSIGPRGAKLLPLMVRYGDMEIARSSVEISSVNGDHVTFEADTFPETVEIRAGSIPLPGTWTSVGNNSVRSLKPRETISIPYRI